MTKLTDAIKSALAKKHAAQHPDAKTTETDGRVRAKTPAPAANKPPKKVTGRGR